MIFKLCDIPKPDDYDLESFLNAIITIFNIIIFLLIGSPRIADSILPSKESDYNSILIDPLKRLFFQKYLESKHIESGIIFYESVQRYKYDFNKLPFEKIKLEAKKIVNTHLIAGCKYEIMVEPKDIRKKIVSNAEKDEININLFDELSEIVMNEIIVVDCPHFVDSVYSFQSAPYINWYNTFEKFNVDIKVALYKKINDHCNNPRIMGDKYIEIKESNSNNLSQETSAFSAKRDNASTKEIKITTNSNLDSKRISFKTDVPRFVKKLDTTKSCQAADPEVLNKSFNDNNKLIVSTSSASVLEKNPHSIIKPIKLPPLKTPHPEKRSSAESSNSLFKVLQMPNSPSSVPENTLDSE